MPERREKNGPDNENTRRVARAEIHSRRLPIHHADRQRKEMGSQEGSTEVVLPKLPGISDAQQEWLTEIVDGDIGRARVIGFVAKLEPIKISRFVRRFQADKDAAKIIDQMATHGDDQLIDDIQGYITGSDITKISDDLRKGSGETRHRIIDIVNENLDIGIEHVPHEVKDLLDIDDPVERERAIHAVWQLMQKYSFRNVAPDDRMAIGCIYHVSKTVAELKTHIAKAVFYPILRRTDTGKIFAFVQVEKGRRIAKIEKTRTIRHRQNGKLNVILKTPEEEILHEQLIVVDQDEKFEGKKIKGGGKKLIDWCRDMARGKGAKLMTTEVQSGNGASEIFHRKMGYTVVGQIEERPQGADPVHFNIFVYDLRESGQQDPALLKNDSPTPTVEGS